VDFLPGSLPLTGAVSPEFAADVVWLDAYIPNVDRTPRNPNLLRWHGEPWLIDHGAALYAQHGTDDLPGAADRAFGLIADHVLLPGAGPIADAAARLTPRMGEDAVRAAAALVPDAWLVRHPREAYAEFLSRRVARGDELAREAEDTRT
jgi:hypothetical protein